MAAAVSSRLIKSAMCSAAVGETSTGMPGLDLLLLGAAGGFSLPGCSYIMVQVLHRALQASRWTSWPYTGIFEAPLLAPEHHENDLCAGSPLP